MKKPVKPEKLKRGDCVGVVAPAGCVEPKQLERGIRVIEKMGLKPILGKYVCSRHRYFAGTDRERSEDLMAMFKDERIKGIFCARGGYGADRVIPHLKLAIIRKNPKIFVGSSDITLLLLHLSRKCSLVTFHGPMVAGSFGRQPMIQSRKQFKEILTRKQTGKKLFSSKIRVVQPGRVKAELTGGCLTLLCRSLKTSGEIDTRNRILLIEDVNEPLYRIDGMLWQLKKAGKFKQIKGIIFGEMIDCRAGKHGGNMKDIILEVFEGLDIPILTHAPIGHGKEMWTVPFGIEGTLDSKSRSLTLDYCGVI